MNFYYAYMEFPQFLIASLPVSRCHYHKSGYIFLTSVPPIRYLYMWIKSPWASSFPVWTISSLLSLFKFQNLHYRDSSLDFSSACIPFYAQYWTLHFICGLLSVEERRSHPWPAGDTGLFWVQPRGCCWPLLLGFIVGLCYQGPLSPSLQSCFWVSEHSAYSSAHSFSFSGANLAFLFLELLLEYRKC